MHAVFMKYSTHYVKKKFLVNLQKGRSHDQEGDEPEEGFRRA